MPPQWNLAIDFFQHRIGVFGALHGREHVTWGYGTHSYLGREFQSHGSSQLNHSCLGRIVIGLVGLADNSIGRSGLQNDSTVVFPHMPCSCLGHVEDAGQVHCDDFVPLSGSDFKKIVANADARIVDQRIDLAEAGMLREDAYDLVQSHAMRAWKDDLSFREEVARDPKIAKLLGPKRLARTFDYSRQLTNVDAILKRVLGS